MEGEKVMRYHKYKNKSGGYYRGRSRAGRYYTRPSGCLLPVLIIILVIISVTSLFI